MSKKHKNEDAPEPAVEPEVQPPVQEEESLKNQLLRLQADFDNFRKRTLRERNELFLFANESLFLEMLPIIDHFEMGFKSAEGIAVSGNAADYRPFRNGLQKRGSSPDRLLRHRRLPDRL